MHNTKVGHLTKNYFGEKNGIKFAGIHLIIDMWGASKLDDIEHVKSTIIKVVRQCEATLLNLQMHYFASNGGISGFAILAESHLSLHSWPEKKYLACDIFMCGNANPRKAIPVLKKAFKPTDIILTEQIRGCH